MSLSRWTVALIGVGAVGLALVGVGAGATFTTSTTSSQSFSAGTLSMAVSSDDAAGCRTAASNCQSLTLPAVGPVSSTFETPKTVITMTNTGNIPAHFSAIQIGQSHDGTVAANNALLNETYVCIQSTDYSGGPWTEGNGPLTTAVALTPTVAENDVTLAPGATATYSMDFYAGKDSGACNPVSSDGSHTKAAWDGYDGGPYHTPASLNDDAQGGVVTPTLTFSYTG